MCSQVQRSSSGKDSDFLNNEQQTTLTEQGFRNFAFCLPPSVAQTTWGIAHSAGNWKQKRAYLKTTTQTPRRDNPGGNDHEGEAREGGELPQIFGERAVAFFGGGSVQSIFGGPRAPIHPQKVQKCQHRNWAPVFVPNSTRSSARNAVSF